MLKRVSVFLLVLAMMFTLSISLASADENRNFTAHLSGGNEVPAVDTNARGQVIFNLSKDGTQLHYKLIASNIENVIASHIHLAPAGVNGPVVVFLYGPVAAGGGRSDGLLAEGVIVAADLTGSLTGQPLSDLVTQMRQGNAYVNVHTDDGVAPANTGAGDKASGEIRGQIR